MRKLSKYIHAPNVIYAQLKKFMCTLKILSFSPKKLKIFIKKLNIYANIKYAFIYINYYNMRS